MPLEFVLPESIVLEHIFLCEHKVMLTSLESTTHYLSQCFTSALCCCCMEDMILFEASNSLDLIIPNIS